MKKNLKQLSQKVNKDKKQVEMMERGRYTQPKPLPKKRKGWVVLPK